MSRVQDQSLKETTFLEVWSFFYLLYGIFSILIYFILSLLITHVFLIWTSIYISLTKSSKIIIHIYYHCKKKKKSHTFSICLILPHPPTQNPAPWPFLPPFEKKKNENIEKSEHFNISIECKFKRMMMMYPNVPTTIIEQKLQIEVT